MKEIIGLPGCSRAKEKRMKDTMGSRNEAPMNIKLINL